MRYGPRVREAIVSVGEGRVFEYKICGYLGLKVGEGG